MPAPDPSVVRYRGAWRHADVHANGIRFHIVEAAPVESATDNPQSDRLVILVHGFADFWWSWRHQLIALTEAGFRAVSVDLRGYGDSDKPPRGYDGWTLANDIAGLVRALGHARADLVGHADGGMVCWATAALRPEVVRSIAVIGSPHPISLKRTVLRHRAQRRAWLPSFLARQLPLWPEYRLTRRDGVEVDRTMRRRSSKKWAQTAEYSATVARMRSAIQIPGAAHSALEYHRWAFRSQWRGDGRRFMKMVDRVVEIPVLCLRGGEDRYVVAEGLIGSQEWAPLMQVHTVDGAGHFCHQEAPDDVNAELIAFYNTPM